MNSGERALLVLVAVIYLLFLEQFFSSSTRAMLLVLIDHHPVSVLSVGLAWFDHKCSISL